MDRPPTPVEMLLGRERWRSIFAFGIACGAFLLLYHLVVNVGVIPDLDDLPLVTFVVVTGATAAAVNAYWNDGVLASWVLVVGLAYPWRFDVGVQPAFSLTAALVVGTSGYVVGWALRQLTSGQWWEDTLPPEYEGLLANERSTTRELVDLFLRSREGRRILVGREATRLGSWLVLACGLGVVGAWMMATTPAPDPPASGGLLRFSEGLLQVFDPVAVLNRATVVTWVGFLGWIGLALWPAYESDGLIASWGVVLVPLFGTYLVYFPRFGQAGTPTNILTFAFVAALAITLVVGTAGFVLGTMLRIVAAGAGRTTSLDG